MELLNNRKSYLMALGVGVTAALLTLKIIDGEQATALFGLFGAGGIAALRAGIAKGGA